jgi:putative transposase
MQTIYPHNAQYHVKKINGTVLSEVAQERLQKLDSMTLLLSDGCQEEVALQAVGLKRSNYYRYKKRLKEFGPEGLENESKRPLNVRKPTCTREIEQRVHRLRKKYPLWGKQKIAVMYNFLYPEKISESTVGRIITRFIKESKIMPVSWLQGRKVTKKRVFNDHAQRWKYGMKGRSPGELVQIDHMTIMVPGIGQIKHFTAVCPTSKWVEYKAYQRATSHNAADFLEHIHTTFPFTIRSIQVDGGSEFMSDFEKTCKIMGIPLYVLPPRSPECNGAVERSNGTAKYEFYSQYDDRPKLHNLRKKLEKFTYFYNHTRPHQGIGLLTPHQFYEEIKKR